MDTNALSADLADGSLWGLTIGEQLPRSSSTSPRSSSIATRRPRWISIRCMSTPTGAPAPRSSAVPSPCCMAWPSCRFCARSCCAPGERQPRSPRSRPSSPSRCGSARRSRAPGRSRSCTHWERDATTLYSQWRREIQLGMWSACLPSRCEGPRRSCGGLGRTSADARKWRIAKLRGRSRPALAWGATQQRMAGGLRRCVWAGSSAACALTSATGLNALLALFLRSATRLGARPA